MPIQEAKILSVTKLNEYVKLLVEGNPILSRVFVRGEISNLTRHASGHLYFSLKEEGARVAAVMFRAQAEKLTFRPENGMTVIVQGRVSVYTRDGAYQVYVNAIEPDGIGALAIAFEQCKRRLQAEGLFDEALKKPLPKIPLSIGVITSPTGAAIRDILQVTKRRFPLAEIVLYPALVQGEGAEGDLVNGIRYFSDSKRVDVVIIGRGGGSIEDLWAFNSEKLAREIRRSSIPVISAVGHETDFTICDFVSDKRAPTPSAAAELATPDSTELLRKFENVTARMSTLLASRIKGLRASLEALSERPVLTDPMRYIEERRMAVIALTEELSRAQGDLLREHRYRLMRLASVLEAVSPLKVMTKGYAAVLSDEGRPLCSVKEIRRDQALSLRMADGTVGVEVREITEL